MEKDATGALRMNPDDAVRVGLDEGGRARVVTGVAPNELTDNQDRDLFAGTPWHKSVPARIEAV